MIKLKSKEEIKILREGGKILSAVLKRVEKMVKPGITTGELDLMAEGLILEAGGEPSFKNYGDIHNPYPATLCTSVNENLVHGIPNDYILKNGDIIGLDIGMRFPKQNGLYTDMAVTVAVGKVDKEHEHLIKVAKHALDIWIKNLKPGKNLNDIAKLVQKYIEDEGFGVIRDLVGHGVGHAVHEDPQIPNYYIPNFNVILKEGMVLAFEPMVSVGHYKVETLDDGWTVATKDKSFTSHFEHTVVITKRGCDVITR